MGRMNIGRVLLGGIVAGIVADILGYLVDGMWLAQRWEDGMLALGKSGFATDQIIWFNILGLVGGIVTIWIYAAVRPRLGGGIGTALIVGVMVWVIASLIPNLSFMWFTGLFTKHLTAFRTAGNLAEIVIGTVAGAALYKDA